MTKKRPDSFPLKNSMFALSVPQLTRPSPTQRMLPNHVLRTVITLFKWHYKQLHFLKFEISFFLNSIKSVTSCNNTVTIDTVLGIDGLLFSPENLSDLSLSLGHVWDTLHWSGSSPEGTSFWTPVTFTTGSVYLQPSLDVSFIAHQCIRPSTLTASCSKTQSCTANSIILSNKIHKNADT